MTPDLVTNLLTQVPNFAIAVWCISNYQATIKQLIDQENKLLDQLLARVSTNDKQQEQAANQKPELIYPKKTGI